LALDGAFPRDGLDLRAGSAFFTGFTVPAPRALARDLDPLLGFRRAFGRGFRPLARAFGFDPRLAAAFRIFLEPRDLDFLPARFPAMDDSSLGTSRTASPMGAY